MHSLLPKSTGNDDELPLPPMDGDADDDETNAPDESEELVDVHDEGDAQGDAVAGDDVIGGYELASEESGWLAESEGSPDLDVGTELPFTEDETLTSDVEPAFSPDEGVAFAEERDDVAADRGEEGPLEEDDDLEAGLPAIDGDSSDEAEGGGDIEPGLLDLSSEPAPHRWDDRAWERAEQAIDGALFAALALDGGHVLAAGDTLVRRSGARRFQRLCVRGLATPMRSLAARGDNVAVVDGDGTLWLSADAGASFVDQGPAGRWTAVAMAGAKLWLGGDAGLFTSADGGSRWTLAAEGAALGLVADGDDVVALMGTLGATPTHVVRPGAGAVTQLSAPLRALRLERTGGFSVCGPSIAFLAARVGVFRSAGGEPFRRVDGTDDATAITLLDDRGSLAVALFDEDSERSLVLAVTPAGDARIVAEIGEGPSDTCEKNRVLALRWSDGVLYAAGGFGLVALRPPVPPKRS